ncbi:desulfoferrodoxin [Clostridium polyendosporum]|uniref:Desulfoferrodoxin n=1 Tax=Clostridium polyendosporum TaxID=69208 RepID=A0A919RZT7_9CLOT|nr:desulfoferrodoxin [Clostridium polyendosporum]GIM28721.1 desulfoferrodoxin [Clostridium polyendosporum]
MTQINQVYKCDKCGNIVEVAHEAGGTLYCCGQPMTLKVENTSDGAKEKHVPVIDKVEGGIIVKVGSVEHPMVAEHFIEWIEVITTNRVYKKNLKPGEKPQAFFPIEDGIISVREYCNLHGLWKA